MKKTTQKSDSVQRIIFLWLFCREITAISLFSESPKAALSQAAPRVFSLI